MNCTTLQIRAGEDCTSAVGGGMTDINVGAIWIVMIIVFIVMVVSNR